MSNAQMRTFQWLPADGKRHAVPGGKVTRGAEIETLVGEAVTVPTQRLGETEWQWPTCKACWDAAKDCIHVSLSGLGYRAC
jgi:hypothetical protein